MMIYPTLCRFAYTLLLICAVHVPATFATDMSIHSVPLDHIVLDDFRGGAIPLNQASPQLIATLKDRILPLTTPQYDAAQDASWLTNDDLILGFVENGDARAFPTRILNFHEIVNDIIGGRPVLISYCPLRRSGLVFDRQVEAKLLTFGNTNGLYESDMVMYDHQTENYWFQVGGEAIVGSLTGTRLTLLRAFLLPWSEWQTLYPNTRVLSRNTGLSRPYHRNPFLGYDELGTRPGFPVSTNDRRLDPKEKVLGLERNEGQRAYSLTQLGKTAVMDTLGGTPVVIFSGNAGPSGAAFDTTAEATTLSFFLEQGRFTDHQTRSQWNLAGEATDGHLRAFVSPLFPHATPSGLPGLLHSRTQPSIISLPRSEFRTGSP